MDPRRILIVEDESIVRLHLRRIVEGMGHLVVGVAATSAEAVARAAEGLPDLVIMDIHLGEQSDGVEAARSIIGAHGSAVLFATAFADDRTIARTADVGAVGYIVKPFGEPAVRAAITTALREHDRSQASRRNERELAGIIGSLGEAVFQVDAELRVRFLNRRAGGLAFADGADTTGRDLRELLRPADDDGAGFWDAVAAACRDRVAALTPTIRLQLPDGGVAVVNGSVEPRGDDDGAGCVISLRDVSQRWFGSRGEPGRQVAESPRMIIYSHDTFGLGHLRRSLNLAAALVRAVEDLSILIVTGSAVAHRFPLPPRVDYVKLPAVRKTANEKYAPRSLALGDDDVRDLRANLIERVVRDFRPHLLLADHAPAGMRGELRPALSWLRENLPDCRTVVGLRDIIDEPAAVVADWRAREIYRLLEESYDHVVIYGQRGFHDTIAAYALPAAVAARARFVGHVVEEIPDTAAAAVPPAPGRRIVVTTGGGDGAVEALCGGFLRMLASHPLPADVETVLFPGPLAPPATVAELRELAAGLPARVIDFVESTSPWMASADLVVCTGGYNTTMQALRYARRMLVVPRALHRQEQALRAARLAELGLARTLDAATLDSQGLHAAVLAMLAEAGQPLAAARAAGEIVFDGAGGLAAFCAGLLAPAASGAEAAHD